LRGLALYGGRPQIFSIPQILDDNPP